MAQQSPELPSHMKAQFLDTFNEPYHLRSVPLPELASEHDLLIKVDAASYCHTDAVLAAGQMKPNPPKFPHIGCHEFAGTVVANHTNPSSFARNFAIGDKVGVPGRGFHPCGSCFECQDIASEDSDIAGYSVYCPHALNHGISADGGFREYAVVDARQIAPIPNKLTTVDTAPLMCAGVTVYAALKRCHLAEGGTVAIIGCGGGLGHLGLQYADALGYEIIGVDNADAPLELSKKLKTRARVVDSRVIDPVDLVQQLGAEAGVTERGAMGVDAVLILPESQKAFNYGMALLKNHGRCVVVSFPDKGFHISARDLVFRDISVLGSLVGSNKILREMLDVSAAHQIRAVSKRFSLANLNELVREYHKGAGGKLVIDMSLV